MKLTFVTASLSSGGAERVLSLLANDMSKRGHEVEIILLTDPIVFYPIEENIKLTFAEKEIHSKFLIRKVFWQRKHINEVNPDCVIVFLQRVYCITLLSLLGINIPVISSERNDPRYFSLFYKVLIRIFLPLTTHFVVQTENIKKYYPSFIKKKTSIIPNPVNDNVFEKKLPTKRDDKIINVGRLYPQKNQKMLIDAFNIIANKYPNLRLYIYGEGILREELESQVKALNLQDRVLLPSRTNKILDEMNASKFLVMSSNFEGMSNAMIEAICLGLPIITTRVSGTDELMENGKNGYVIEIGDTQALAKAMDNLLSDEKKLNEFSLYNKQLAYKFKGENIFNTWEDLINKVVVNFNGKRK